MKGRALGRSRWDEFYFGCSRSKMIRVGKQFGHRFGFRRVVIAADLTVSIHEHHSCAVHRKTLRIASV